MNCRRARAWSSEYVDGRLSPRRGRALEAHLADCGPCRTAMEDFAAVKGMLSATEPPAPGAEFWDRALARARSGSAPRVTARLAALWRWQRAAAWATAASAACLVAVMPVRLQQRRAGPASSEEIIAWHARYCAQQPFADHGQMRLVGMRAQLPESE
jgi:anti-sigma factor RsiW